MQMHYPEDEVGNLLCDPELLEKHQINPYSDVIEEDKFNELFGQEKHIFTGINYIEFFKE